MFCTFMRFLFKLTRFVGVSLAALFAGLWLWGERGHLLLPSTRAHLREAGGWRALFTVDYWHSYVYGRWPEVYIGRAIRHYFPWVARHLPADGSPPAADWSHHYHGKVLPTQEAQNLITINRPIPRQDLEQVIPYRTAREIVLSGNPDVVAFECACRAARENPCTPTQVCMIVGQPFTDFMLEHHPHKSRRLSNAEAVQLLQDEHERGHVHVAFFKNAMFNRFYAICNCCVCCCGGLDAMLHLNVPMVTSSGYVAQFESEHCTACEACADACPFEAIHVNGAATLDWEKCLGCGVCVEHCTQGLISLVRDARKGQPLIVADLLADPAL